MKIKNARGKCKTHSQDASDCGGKLHQESKRFHSNKSIASLRSNAFATMRSE